MQKPFVYSNLSPVANKPFIIEQWRSIDNSIIPNATGKYAISNCGRVMNLTTGHILKPYMNKRKTSNLCDPTVKIEKFINGEYVYKNIVICRAVLKTFAPVNNMDNLEVNHIDGNPENNCITNLCWCTHAENVRFAYQNGQCTYANTKEKRYLSLSENQLIGICEGIQAGKKYSVIAKENGVIYQVPYRIHKGEIYKDWRDKYNLQSIPIPHERNRQHK